MSPQLQLFDARSAADRWTVRVSGRARRLSVRVYPGGRVEVVVPPGASPAAVQKFIGTHRQWIHRRVEDLSTAAAADNSRPASIKLPAIGRHYGVEYEHAGESSARVRVAGENGLIVSGPLHNERAIAAALRSWLADLAHEQLGSELAKVASEGGFRYGARADPQAAYALGQLLRERHDQLEHVPAVPASAGRALPAGPRAVPHATHESLGEILGAGGEHRARLSRARSGAAARLAKRAGMDVLVSDQDPNRPSRPVDLSDEQVHWDLGESQSYGQYLNLELLLSAQRPVSVEHDEMLFIIIHQASELWMKLCLHELTAARDHIRRDDLGPSFKMLARVSRIQAQLVQSWDVLATMTPAEYSMFRNQLGRASGFQSTQYRMLEFVIGNKNAEMIEVHRRDATAYEALQRALQTPSIYDESLRLLSRRGFEIPEEYLDRDWSQPYQANKQVAAAWLSVYHSVDANWDLYELAEKLVDLDHHFQLWRFSHMKTVERIIGYKRGTGGTSGVSYLTKALELRFFPELWSIRTAM